MSKRRLLALVVTPVAVVLALMVAGMRVNINHSVPYGLYWQGHTPKPRHNIVDLCAE